MAAQLIWLAGALGMQWGSTYLEVGANDGLQSSNTLLLEKCHGWSGLLIEGNPASYERLQVNRPGNTNLHFALCKHSGHVDFTVSSSADSTRMTTGDVSLMPTKFREGHIGRFSLNATGGIQTTRVPCKPLQRLLDLHGFAHIDFLSLDVEGAEVVAVQSLDWTRFSVDAMFVEVQGDRYGKSEHDRAIFEILDNRSKTGLCRLPRSFMWDRNELWLSHKRFGAVCEQCAIEPGVPSPRSWGRCFHGFTARNH